MTSELYIDFQNNKINHSHSRAHVRNGISSTLVEYRQSLAHICNGNTAIVTSSTLAS